MSQSSTWLTCSPYAFVGGDVFFSRDSGLLQRGFQSIGIGSKAVIEGVPKHGDHPDLIRASAADLRDPQWWKGLHAEGVVLYAWGLPQYTPVARAIREAGCRLVLNMDTGGQITPYVGTRDFCRTLFQRLRHESGPVAGTLKACASLCRSLVPQILDLPRLEHLRQADLIGAVSPIAQARIQKYAAHYGFHDVARKTALIPHAVASYMQYTGEPKAKRMVAVGRWTRRDTVKNAPLLLALLSLILAKHPDYEAVVVGEHDEFFQELLNRMPPECRARLTATGRIPNAETVAYLKSSRISICTSFSESYHTASAEALCCGCSVVGYASPSLPSFPYFTGEHSGSLGAKGTPEAIAAAMDQEIMAWEEGRRDPVSISKSWCCRVHTDCVAKRIIELSTEAQGDAAPAASSLCR